MMIKLLIVLLVINFLNYGYATEKEHSFVLLSNVPNTYQSTIITQSINSGIYVDKLTINVLSSPRLLMQRVQDIKTQESTYFKEINNQMVFVWGNYDDNFNLKTLNFISMYHPEQIHQINNNNIRGMAAKKDDLLFFISREPPKLLSYNLSDKKVSSVNVYEYGKYAENIGVKIMQSGDVFLRGTGLEKMKFPFAINKQIFESYSVNCDITWILLTNQEDKIILQSTEGNKQNLIVGMPKQNKWNYFSIDSNYTNAKLFSNYLIFQTLPNVENGCGVYIYNIDNNKHNQLVLPPFSKIIYFSSQYMIIAQPYRLLVFERKENKFSLIDSVYLNEAWYIKMVLRDMQ